jgi:hypothetical protein
MLSIYNLSSTIEHLMVWVALALCSLKFMLYQSLLATLLEDHNISPLHKTIYCTQCIENKEFLLETQIRKKRKFSCTEHLIKWKRLYIS